MKDVCNVDPGGLHSIKRLFYVEKDSQEKIIVVFKKIMKEKKNNELITFKLKLLLQRKNTLYTLTLLTITNITSTFSTLPFTTFLIRSYVTIKSSTFQQYII